ncbi:metallophosphoesterase [Virgibacillus siamensis]|uniref:metallophosphoesterase n=1 Tax=Virgibacillus siamensis TaxID=480071 RepID=UPI0009878C91|nr:metallophosphoesterase [Virgibacillus siamensis]
MKKLLAGFGLLASAFTLLRRIRFETNHFKLNSVSFKSSKLPPEANFTILQMTDLHNKVFGFNNERLVDAAKAVNPDILVLTGDFLDDDTQTLGSVFSLVERLTANHEHVYFVSGNHDWANSRKAEFLNGLHERNVFILNNQSTRITIRDVHLNLVGVDDPSKEHEDIVEAFNSVDTDNYTILLSHAPDIIRMYRDIPADLILCGHTHGGQIRSPFFGALIAPDQGLFPKLDKGVFEFGPEQYLYIDSGLGTSRIPVRFLNQSQLSLVTIIGQ